MSDVHFQLRRLQRGRNTNKTKKQSEVTLCFLIQLQCNSHAVGARLVTGAGRLDHITPVLRRLHWLPVRQRVVLKVAGLVHQSLDGVAPVEAFVGEPEQKSPLGKIPTSSYDVIMTSSYE